MLDTKLNEFIHFSDLKMERDILIAKRKKAKELKAKGWSNRKIARYLVASKDSVGKWIKMEDEAVEMDHRGWEKGKLRKHEEEEKERIKNLRKELIKENSYFIGDKVIQSNYENLYGNKLPLWFINKTLKENGLVKSIRKKEKGRSKYMKYPVNTINRLGKSMMSIDFIGPKYLTGSSERVNYLTCKYIRPSKKGIVKRVSGQTTQEAINVLMEIWKINPIPEVLKIDNDSAFGANLTHKMCVGKLTLFLLNLGVTPLYIAPRSPWNNGDVEGFNSVFSKKFWNHLKFTDEEEIDINIEDFNVSYEKYSHLIDNNAEIKYPKYITDFKGIDFSNTQINKLKSHRIYFLRIVRRKGNKADSNEEGYINILGKEIVLGKDLINLFVFCEVNIKEEKLTVNTENEAGQLIEIKRINFKIKNINN
jgi:hypothetical protein